MSEKAFGEKLRELRKRNKLTQKELASMIGITKSVVSFYELGDRTPSPDILRKLAQIFHVSADYLLGIEKADTIDVSGLDTEDITAINTMVKVLREKNQKIR